MQVHRGVARPPAAPAHSRYLAVLTWSFTLFNAARLLSYLPTLWAIWAVGDSQQHSLLTWLTWTGANMTMAAWLYEQEGRRFTRSVAVSACNAAMCVVTSVLIVGLRA